MEEQSGEERNRERMRIKNMRLGWEREKERKRLDINQTVLLEM